MPVFELHADRRRHDSHAGTRRLPPRWAAGSVSGCIQGLKLGLEVWNQGQVMHRLSDT